MLDRVIVRFDRVLRTLTGNLVARRPSPAGDLVEGELDAAQRTHAARLMRVNHSGEVCAQALYDGQATTARKASIKASLQEAARDESDHLAWCAQRLRELETRPSLLNPLFYAGSYAIGAAVGLVSDRLSLGFVEATEDQVCAHLDRHLASLPEDDTRSRAILRVMRDEEAEHGARALAAGGIRLPALVKGAMTQASRLMTVTSYRI